MLRGLEQPIPSRRGATIAGSDDWSCRRMLRTRLGVFLEVPRPASAALPTPLGLAPLASGKDQRDCARLDAIPVEHPQQARVSMSNHDQTKVRRTQASRGHAGRDAQPTRARRPASPAACCGQHTRRRAARRAQSVTKLSRTVTGLRKIRNGGCVSSWPSAGTRRERRYVLAMSSAQHPPTRPGGPSS